MSMSVDKIENRRDYDLSQFSYFKTGGTCEICFFPKTADEIKEVIFYIKKTNKSFKIIGATSNVLFLDDHAVEVLVSLKNFNDFHYESHLNIITAGAGYRLPGLVRKALKLGLAGFEGLEGVPGTVGGGLYQNAEAFGNSMSDYLLDVTVIDMVGEIKVYHKSELDFSFRHSLFMEKNLGVILSARFSPNMGKKQEETKDRIDVLNANRRRNQESEFPNLGSIFSTKDIYLDIAKHHFFYQKLVSLCRRYYRFSNPDNNRLLNQITCLWFGLKFDPKPFSDKTLNCFINAPGVRTDLVLSYIEQMKVLTNNEIEVEVEII